MTDLPPVGGAAWAFGNAVNDRDQVVGNENTASNHEIIAALWSGGHGYDLNTLAAPNPLQMISADYITDQGDIFGHGVLPNGDQRIFLMIRNPGVPLPPASTPRRPLPAITGPTDHSIRVRLALRAAGLWSAPEPPPRTNPASPRSRPDETTPPIALVRPAHARRLIECGSSAKCGWTWPPGGEDPPATPPAHPASSSPSAPYASCHRHHEYGGVWG